MVVNYLTVNGIILNYCGSNQLIRDVLRKNFPSLAKEERHNKLVMLIDGEFYDIVSEGGHLLCKLPEYSTSKEYLTAIEFAIRYLVIKSGWVLVHGAATYKESNIFVFLGEGGLGKTKWSLDNVFQKQHQLIGDDRFWINSDGRIFPYHRYLVLKRSYPSLNIMIPRYIQCFANIWFLRRFVSFLNRLNLGNIRHVDFKRIQQYFVAYEPIIGKIQFRSHINAADYIQILNSEWNLWLKNSIDKDSAAHEIINKFLDQECEVLKKIL